MQETHLYFGWRTALLGLAAVEIIILAFAVAITPTHRPANRLLSAALLVVAGLLTPYAIGFAGAYDLWRWLTFAPFAIPLALGPLLYGYARTLQTGRLPSRMAIHLLPAGIQAAYFTICFLLPLGLKWSWYTGGHQGVVTPAFAVLALASLGAYAWAIGSVLERYRARLADQHSDDDRFAARWLSRVRAAIVIGLVVEAGFWLWSVLTGGIDYFQETGLYFALAGLGLYLGVAGWRHAGLTAHLRPEAGGPAIRPSLRPASDWSTIGADLVGRTRAEGWWREPDLNLARLARLMGTNTGRVSRAINLGLGINFSVFINGLRAEGVAEALRARPGTDLLDLALEMGFASKASFNRAFRARFGMSPSQYRRQASDRDSSQTGADVRRTEA